MSGTGIISAMETSVIYCGDNVDVLAKYVPDNSVDLIYIDPLFNMSRNYEVSRANGIVRALALAR